MTEPVVLDCLGEFCPMPLIKLNELVRSSEPGTLIRVLSDDEGSKADIPVWCRMKGQEFIGREALERGWAFDVRTTNVRTPSGDPRSSGSA